MSAPVHLEGALDREVSRWLWLVKWVLVIPHYVVLVFLWLAFAVMTAFAFVAILFSGRYPRGIFEFNVGVLRWSWRVGFYAYSALGTDRYPPFTLGEVADYPAHLEIDYPERLSRGLVLVKWWLLAIPHYLIVGLFIGGGWVAFQTAADEGGWLVQGGLIGLLVLVAGIVLLFSGRYPQAIFDLVIGLNRWVIRVAAYAALMTDVYPPFRLDQGGADPDASTVAVPPPATPTAPVAPPRPWGAGRVVALVLGCTLLASSLALGVGGTFLGVANTVLRDDDGYVMTGGHDLSSDAYAVLSPSFEVHADPPADRVPEELLGKVQLTADVSQGDSPMFLGIARSEDVDAYLNGVALDTVDRLSSIGGDTTYDRRAGGPPPSAPGEQGFWIASDSGTDRLSVTWKPRNGDWTFVLMQASGASGVAATVEVGATAPFLGWATALVLVLAGLLAVAATGVLVAVLRGDRTISPQQAGEER
ncbi:MAG TPA: DUF4389 domain-containing protein [Nocardioidaceae bacterium]|nr:DUF4389 domain-containing protein [Nocardioidaceae bacterium]